MWHFVIVELSAGIDHIGLHSSFAIPDGSDDMVKVNTLALGTIYPPPLNLASVPPILKRCTQVSVPPDYGY